MSAYETIALGHVLCAEVTRLDEGWDIGIYGGCRTHVGAAALCEAGGGMRMLLREGHRDDVVAASWAKAFARRFNEPVCVRCGIHYDGASKSDIEGIVSACNLLLQKALDAEAARDEKKENETEEQKRRKHDHKTSDG